MIVSLEKAFWKIAIDSATSSAITVRKTTPATSSRLCSRALS